MDKLKKFFSHGCVRLIAVALAAAVLTGVVAATAGKLPGGKVREGLYYEASGLQPDGVLLEVDGEPITVEEYLYWVANDCNYLLNYGGVTDLADYVTEDMTYADYVRSDVLTTVRMYGAVRAWAKEQGVALTSAQQAELAEQRQTYVDYYGDEASYLRQLALLGISEECFDRINETPYLYAGLVERCADPGSDLYPGEETLQSFADEQGLLTARIVCLATDPAWSEAELEEQKAALAAYAEELQHTDDKDAVFSRLSDDLGLDAETLTFAAAAGDVISDAAATLEVGQSSELVSNGVDYYLIQRLATDPSQIIADYVASLVEQRRDEAVVVYNSDLYDAIDVLSFYSSLVELQNARSVAD